ncbi:EAL domain-containing protein, partial [Halobellus sp. Atlit-31R]
LTLELGPGDVPGMLAHLYRVLAFLCLYLAIIRDGLHGAVPGATQPATAAGPQEQHIGLESMLEQAIERKQLALQYQPRIRVKDGSIVGVEALVRWRHPVLGLLAPARFIPLAEQSSLINDIDLWVLREACARAAAWRAAGLFHGRVSVNVSARQFQQPGLAQRVRAALDQSGLEPGGLELE